MVTATPKTNRAGFAGAPTSEKLKPIGARQRANSHLARANVLSPWCRTTRQNGHRSGWPANDWGFLDARAELVGVVPRPVADRRPLGRKCQRSMDYC